MSNAKLRAHVGLFVSDASAASLSGIRVGEEIRKWSQGQVIIFDDSFEHEVWWRAEAKQAGDAEMQAKLAELKAFELHIERQKESLSNKLNAEAILSDLVRNGVVKDFGGGEWGPAQDFEH